MNAELPGPLEHVSTADLLAELLTRYSACIFSGIKVGIQGRDERQNRWGGPRPLCVYLSVALQQDILKDIDGMIKNIDDKDRA